MLHSDHDVWKQRLIAQTSRNAEPKLPAVSSLEACPTPAERGCRWHPPTADVRQPLTMPSFSVIASYVRLYEAIFVKVVSIGIA